MNQTLDIQDISIVLAAKKLNPTIVTPDFLTGSGIVPGEWELARPPVLSSQGTQISFKNGIKLEAKPGTISFAQGMNSQNLNSLDVPSLARRYAAALPNLEYRGVGINPRRFVPFAGQSDAAHNYMTQTLLAPGAWQNFGKAPIQAGINLVYTLENSQLRLTINEARLQLPEREPIPAVLFSGNFHYAITGESPEERQTNLNQAIENWHSDIVVYEELIDNQFLADIPAEVKSVFFASEQAS
ncbi:hypothetical protein [Coleofasciculus chthonoplastes]|uniref:hypothetical protein n=1 Tax=Coleofasciculus chthonoplastes TaxID=64178 RepID=UPI003301C384